MELPGSTLCPLTPGSYFSAGPKPFSRVDYSPVTTGSPPVSLAQDPKVTFQTAPKLSDCDPLQPNTGDPAGMPCGMGDGSVRRFAPSIAPEVFWGAVTPAGGEATGD